MGWMEPHLIDGVKGGTGTTKQIEDAHGALDERGVVPGSLAFRILMYFYSSKPLQQSDSVAGEKENHNNRITAEKEVSVEDYIRSKIRKGLDDGLNATSIESDRKARKWKNLIWKRRKR